MQLNERGDSKLPLIIMVLVLAAIIFVVVKVAPARINAYQYKDFMEEYARQDAWQHSDEQIKKDLLEKAARLNLPLKPEDITMSKGGGSCRLRAKFDVPVDLKIRTWVLHYDFEVSAEHY